MFFSRRYEKTIAQKQRIRLNNFQKIERTLKSKINWNKIKTEKK